jgi:hypothetical protein
MRAEKERHEKWRRKMGRKTLLTAVAVVSIALCAPASAFTANDFTDEEWHSMRTLCKSKWEFNEQMRRHCEENQARAIFWIKHEFASWTIRLIQTYARGLSVDPKAFEGRVKELILACGKKWYQGDEVYDYAMIRYCMQKAFEDWLSAEKKAQGL